MNDLRVSLRPGRGLFRPGEPLTLTATVAGPPGAGVALRLLLVEAEATVAELGASVTLDAGGTGAAAFAWTPALSDVGAGGGVGAGPAAAGPWRAFGADLTATTDGGPAAIAGGLSATTATALDVAPHWSCCPRYGFLSDFAPGSDAGLPDRLDGLAAFHQNVVQFYDWMYTHYCYLPPEPVFTDPLGRRSDMNAVRAAVAGLHERGMAALAYGALYGAEPEFSLAHPDWLLYDGAGEPWSLAHLFYIQDFSAGQPWREHILGEYAAAIREVSFDGIHIDQYGLPRCGRSGGPDGPLVDLALAFPDFVAAAAERVAATRPGAVNLFNNVNNWPTALTARAPQGAVYIEVWPPHERYADLVTLVRQTRSLAPDRHVILAAYLRPFHPDQAYDPHRLGALALATAVIHACGGTQLLLGEGDGVLAEAYYPRHGHLRPDELPLTQQLYDFLCRYGPLLRGPGADVSDWCAGAGVSDYVFSAEGVRFDPLGHAPCVFVNLREAPGCKVINLVNLMGADPHWNQGQPLPAPVGPIEVSVQVVAPVAGVWHAAPDRGSGAPQSLDWRVEVVAGLGAVLRFTLPELRLWELLWIRTATVASVPAPAR